MRIERAARYGNAAFDTSSRLAPARTRRAAGPHRPITASSSVTSRTSTEPSRGRCMRIQPRSPGTKPDPVTTRKRSSASRMTVTSASIPAARVEELRVDDAAGRLPDVVVREALEERQRARPPDVELPERGHVEEAGALAHGAVLLAHPVEEGGAPPSPRALVRPGAPPGPARLEVDDALPAVLLAEHAPERRGTVRRAARGAAPAPTRSRRGDSGACSSSGRTRAPARPRTRDPRTPDRSAARSSRRRRRGALPRRATPR